MQYSDDHWTFLWSLVNDESVRLAFLQYLRTKVDTGKIRIGRAPMASAKADAAAEQCPVGTKWLKTAVLDEPTCAAHVPVSVSDDYDVRTKWEEDKQLMTFKSRGSVAQAFHNLLGEEYETALLAADYGKQGQRSSLTTKCVLPLNHISKCVLRQFQGQSWLKVNEDDIKRDLLALGIPYKSARLAGRSKHSAGLWFFGLVFQIGDWTDRYSKSGHSVTMWAKGTAHIPTHKLVTPWIFSRHRFSKPST